MNVPLTYICNSLYDADPHARGHPLELNPAILKNPRVILAYENPERRKRAFLHATILKTIQTKKITWVLVNRLKGLDGMKQIHKDLDAIVPGGVKIDSFRYRDPNDLKNPRIMISTYQRFLNKILERRLVDVGTVVFHNFTEGDLKEHLVKELILSQLLHYKKLRKRKKPKKFSPQDTHIVMIYTVMPEPVEIPLARLGLIEPNQIGSKQIAETLKQQCLITGRDCSVDHDVRNHVLLALPFVDYFILGSCYRRALTKADLKKLLNNSQYGILCSMGVQPEEEALRPTEDDRYLYEMIKERVSFLLQEKLLQNPPKRKNKNHKSYYKTSAWGKALVRYGVLQSDHEEIMAVIQANEQFVQRNLNYLDEFLSNIWRTLNTHKDQLKQDPSFLYEVIKILRDKIFPRPERKSFDAFYQDLSDCSNQTTIRDFRSSLLRKGQKHIAEDRFFTDIIRNIYLRMPLNQNEYEQETEERDERESLNSCKSRIIEYLRNKPEPKMASLKELLLELKDFSKYILRKCLNELFFLSILFSSFLSLFGWKNEGRLLWRANYVDLHRKVNCWGFSFPEHACTECYPFTTDHRCALWKIIAQEDQDLVPRYLLPRSKESYNGKSYACFMFHEKPWHFREQRKDPNELKEDLRLNPPLNEPVLLSATIFPRYAKCKTDAVLTLLRFAPYNRAMQRGMERHRIFQRVNENILRDHDKKGGNLKRVEAVRYLGGLQSKFIYKIQNRFTEFEHLRSTEALQFHAAYIHFLKRKIESVEKEQFTHREILRALFGGIPRVEEEFIGTSVKGRADLTVYSEHGVKVVDLKGQKRPEHALQLMALAEAIKERAQARREQLEVTDLVIFTCFRQSSKNGDNGAGGNKFEFKEVPVTLKEWEEAEKKNVRIKKELSSIVPEALKLAETCPNTSCVKRPYCKLENVKDFKLRTTPGYRCLTCDQRFEQLETLDGFPAHSLLQCRSCRTTYRHFKVWDRKKKNLISSILIKPDLDHVLVQQANRLGVSLRPLAPFRRREVKIIYPETTFDEARLYEGIYPVLEEGVYPKLSQIGTIIDKKGVLTEVTIKFLKERFNITVIQPENGVKYHEIDPFYEQIISDIRGTEAFPLKMTISNILSRYTFSRLALQLLGNLDKRAEIQCWGILDSYLDAWGESNLKVLRNREGSAARIMWDLIKPFFNAREVPINSRKLERRVQDELLFHSSRTAAKTKGNVLVNYYFLKCGEHARLVHNDHLLGWYGTAGLNHGRRRRTLLDEIGLVVDLNENFKLTFLLGLLKALHDGEITKWNVWSWIGSRRMKNYYLGWKILDKVDERCKDIWENGYLEELAIEKTSLRADYANFLQEVKANGVLLCQDLLTQTTQDRSYLYYLNHPGNSPREVEEEIKRYCKDWVEEHFEPFTLKSDRFPVPDEEKWDFFMDWKRELSGT